MKVGDRVASARPSIAFPLDVHNAGTEVSTLDRHSKNV